MRRDGDYVLVQVDEIEPAPVKRADGWRDMDMRFVLSKTQGVDKLCLFRAVFKPGAAHEKHVHANADEFSFVIRGRAAMGYDSTEDIVGPGTARFIPAGTVHWLRSIDPDEEVEVVGAYLNVGTLEEAGYEFVAHVE